MHWLRPALLTGILLLAMCLTGRGWADGGGPQLVEGPWLPVTEFHPGEDEPRPSGPEEREIVTPAGEAGAILRAVNEARRAAGLRPVTLDPALSRACELHARYLLLNRHHPSVRGLGAHQEHPALPGFSPAGRRAGLMSNIIPDRRRVDPVGACLASLYHRIPLLRPSLRRVGVGLVEEIAVLDVLSGCVGDDQGAVLFPGPGMAGVPLFFQSELPNPLPRGASRRAGHPVTVQFPLDGPAPREVEMSLEDAAGAPVDSHVSHPERPASGFPQQNTLCLIPAEPLLPGETYRVRVRAVVGGRPFVRSWQFTTAAGELGSDE